MSEYIGVGPVLRGSIVLIEEGRLLLVRMVYLETEYVVLPGGQQEQGETLTDCARREAMEETGLNVELDRMLYLSERVPKTSPGFHLVNACFLARRIGGELKTGPVVESDVKVITDIFFEPLEKACRRLSSLGTHLRRDAAAGFPSTHPLLLTTYGD